MAPFKIMELKTNDKKAIGPLFGARLPFLTKINIPIL